MMTEPGRGARLNGLIRALSGSVVIAMLAAATLEGAAAQTEAPHRKVVRQHSARAVALRPLTVRRHEARFVPRPNPDEYEYAPGLFRRWNDPNLDSFGGWRIGGDSFYGDGAGEPITRGNASLGMISGYGPANGGYGGPHFDSVGGFHDAPGPDRQEDADYASGSIWRPDYGDAVPRYPSVKARVARLNTGLYRREPSPILSRSSNVSYPVGPGPAAVRPAIGATGEDDDAPPARADDLLPDLDLGDF